jgi:sulfate transport system substrate-binding protein
MLTLNDPATRGRFEIVMPSISIKAEPPVAWVDKNVAKHGTAKVAEAYLRFLYTPQGQQLIARHFYRPAEPDALPPALRTQFPAVKLVTIDDAFGGWKKAQKTHFDDGGLFDRIYRSGP